MDADSITSSNRAQTSWTLTGIPNRTVTRRSLEGQGLSWFEAKLRIIRHAVAAYLAAPWYTLHVKRYILPAHHPLAPYVQSIWRVQAHGEFASETILPKGNVDLLFNFGDQFGLTGNQRLPNALGETAYVAGLQSGAFTSHPQGEVLLLGVSLNVDACATFLPLPPAELVDLTVEAKLVFADASQLWEQLGDSVAFPQQCRLLMHWLMQQVNPDPKAELIRQACFALRQHPDEACIADQAQRLHLSTRHLRRLFLQHLGVGPAHYLRLIRFIQSLHLMSTPYTLTQIAQEANYFDQAHFCRDFKAIANMTPQEYRARVRHVPGHLFMSMSTDVHLNDY